MTTYSDSAANPSADPSANPSANTAVVAAFIDELFTAGDLSAVDRYLDPAMVDHDPPMGVVPGAEGMRQASLLMRAGCPDWRSERLHMVAQGDLVAEHFVASGTHRGPLFGVEPTGGTLSLSGINLFRIRDGRIVERWGRLDELGLMRQLKLLPEF